MLKNARCAVAFPPAIGFELHRQPVAGRIHGHDLVGAGFGDSQKKAPPSVRTWPGCFRARGMRLDFVDGGVLVNCTGLSPTGNLLVSFKTGHAVLTIATTPRPLVLNIHGDSITGPLAPSPLTASSRRLRWRSPGHGAAYKDSAGNLYDANKNQIAGNANAATPDLRQTRHLPASISRQKAQESASKPCRPIC